MPAIVKAQTTKQAKAAYKARGRPTLSDKEQRQLQRAIELEERAERARGAEKRRTEAAKKRAEKESKERFGREDARLGSQRRTDKFGFVASQFHLGKFFGKSRMQSEVMKAADTGSGARREEGESEDEFGSVDLDDDTLLEALDSAKKSVPSPDLARTSDALSMPPPPIPFAPKYAQARVPGSVSRPSIAPVPFPPRPSAAASPRVGMPVPASKSSNASMAPPPRPVAPSRPESAQKDTAKPVLASKPSATLMPPPPRPVLGLPKARPAAKPIIQEDFDSFWDELDSSTQVARDLGGSRSPVLEEKRADSFCSGDFDMTAEELDELLPPADLGFTFTQLESFIDDDIQLSQAVPG